MARTYLVQKNDTLIKIVKKFYGDITLVSKLAHYNGLLDANNIQINQSLFIPSSGKDAHAFSVCKRVLRKEINYV